MSTQRINGSATVPALGSRVCPAKSLSGAVIHVLASFQLLPCVLVCFFTSLCLLGYIKFSKTKLLRILRAFPYWYLLVYILTDTFILYVHSFIRWLIKTEAFPCQDTCWATENPFLADTWGHLSYSQLSPELHKRFWCKPAYQNCWDSEIQESAIG